MVYHYRNAALPNTELKNKKESKGRCLHSARFCQKWEQSSQRQTPPYGGHPGWCLSLTGEHGGGARCLGMGGIPFLPCSFLFGAMVGALHNASKHRAAAWFPPQEPLVGDLKVPSNSSTSRVQEREVNDQGFILHGGG